MDGTHSNHFLFLVKVNLEAAGVYRCIGQSKNVSGGSATFSVTVTGESMPSFLPRYPPYKLMLYKGQSYDLECKVSNYHAVEYAWGMENRNFKSNIFVSMTQVCTRLDHEDMLHSSNFGLNNFQTDVECI